MSLTKASLIHGENVVFTDWKCIEQVISFIAPNIVNMFRAEIRAPTGKG